MVKHRCHTEAVISTHPTVVILLHLAGKMPSYVGEAKPVLAVIYPSLSSTSQRNKTLALKLYCNLLKKRLKKILGTKHQTDISVCY